MSLYQSRLHPQSKSYPPVLKFFKANGGKPGLRRDGTVVLVGDDMDSRWRFATLDNVLLP